MISLSYPDAPGAQPTDTSQQAATNAASTAAHLRALCLATLKGEDLTADECAAKLERSILSVRPRFSELHSTGFIFDSGVRRKNSSGNNAIVWTIKPLSGTK